MRRHYPQSMSSKERDKAIKADQKAEAASAARRAAHRARVVRDGDGAGIEFPPRDDD